MPTLYTDPPPESTPPPSPTDAALASLLGDYLRRPATLPALVDHCRRAGYPRSATVRVLDRLALAGRVRLRVSGPTVTASVGGGRRA